MTVIFSKKCELGLQAVLFLSTREFGTIFSALEISEKLQVPKEFIAKVLQGLTEFGIVSSKKGKNGGFSLGKPANQIRLIQIIEAIDGLEVFNHCVLGFRDCSSTHPCPVHHKWGKLRDEALQMLTVETLADLREQSLNKILSIQ